MQEVKVLVLTNNQKLISQVVETGSELGEPDCQLIEPFEIDDDGNLSPWLIDVTTENKFMMSSDKLITLCDPTRKLLDKYKDLLE